jgi:hypothetical protein
MVPDAKPLAAAVATMAVCCVAGVAAALALYDPDGETSTVAIEYAVEAAIGLTIGALVGGAAVTVADLTRGGLAGAVVAIGPAAGAVGVVAAAFADGGLAGRLVSGMLVAFVALPLLVCGAGAGAALRRAGKLRR